MTLTDFLLARIADDEAAARGLGHAHWIDDGTWWLEGVEHSVIGPDEVAFTHPAYVPHIVRHDPTRVLAECEAKRRIVEHHTQSEWGHEHDPDSPCHTLRLLALPYVDHPDWREEWKP